jgi:hypothetical protein
MGGAVLFRLERDNQEVIFTVQDKGIGIPEEGLAHLFETFYRSRNVGDIPGTGLGMAIVKSCVDTCGGTIQVKSKENEGTTVFIHLPVNFSPLLLLPDLPSV